ncbi:MAG: hypothetical protein ABSF17_16215 [Terracidiphilus sp.]
MTRSAFAFAVYFLLARLPSPAATPKPCVPADQASTKLNKDVCVSAHIYDVVQLQDGTRFLDVCAPQTPDKTCHFTIVSLWEDRGEVGELLKYLKPNPALARGFSGEQSRPAVNDPNLRPQGAGRAFMNSRDQEPRSPK